MDPNMFDGLWTVVVALLVAAFVAGFAVAGIATFLLVH